MAEVDSTCKQILSKHLNSDGLPKNLQQLDFFELFSNHPN
jgi:hypothetical protein